MVYGLCTMGTLLLHKRLKMVTRMRAVHYCPFRCMESRRELCKIGKTAGNGDVVLRRMLRIFSSEMKSNKNNAGVLSTAGVGRNEVKTICNRQLGYCDHVSIISNNDVERLVITGTVEMKRTSARQRRKHFDSLSAGRKISLNELSQRLVRYCSVEDATLEGAVCCR